MTDGDRDRAGVGYSGGGVGGGCASQSLCGSWESAERQLSLKPEKGHYASGRDESDWQKSK